MLYWTVMTLDPHICYRAMTSRDRRFDGRFFAAVLTTGIYCRPICPAPKPKRRNVRFYEHAAAAEEAGFRPCLRCRPEAAPGTPAWAGTSSTVSRALRLINNGFLDSASVDDLAARLGMGPRHLRRLFTGHVGVSPLSVALTRRVHFAKALIDDTSLPLTEVALSSGFSSVRRFNHAFRRTFNASPSQLRTRRLDAEVNARRPLVLRLPYRSPFHWDAIAGFLGPRMLHGIESFDSDRYRRIVNIDGDVGIVEVENDPGRHQLCVSVPVELSRHLPHVVGCVRRFFDLDADPDRIEAHLGRDPMLASIVQAFPGLRVPGSWNPFETVIRAIVGQQVSVKGATTITARLIERYGEKVQPGPDGLVRVFPTAERLSRARLGGAGMPASRARAIRGVASACRRGELRFDGSMDLDEFNARMVSIPGVGPWTAQYVAMRACGEPDAFPSGDLALRRAAERYDGCLQTEHDLSKRAEAWRPWRAYATMLLWQSYGQ